MHKIGDDTNTANPSGEFTEGVPGVDPATIVKASWLNSVQRELIQLLTAAGLTPTLGQDAQILAALEALYNVDATTAIPGWIEIATDAEAIAKTLTNRALVCSNLAALGASETFAGLVELATNAEVLVGTDTVRALTPAAHKGFHGRGARVYNSGGMSIANLTVTLVAFNLEVFDDAAIHDNVTNNSRLTVPADVTRVSLDAQVEWAANSTGLRDAYIVKNGVVFAGYPYDIKAPVSATNPTLQQVSSGVLDVTPGDYFEVAVYQNSGGSLGLGGGATPRTWFSMEFLD